MVNFDEIEFLESEIVDDDPDAPVGTLVHILDDGTVEESHSEPAKDVEEPIVNEELAQAEDVDDTADDVQDESVQDAANEDGTPAIAQQAEQTVEEPVAQPVEEQVDESVEEAVQEPVAEEPALQEAHDEVVEPAIQEETTVDTVSEDAPTANEVENEDVQAVEDVSGEDVQGKEEAVQEQENAAETIPQQEENVQEVAAVEDTAPATDAQQEQAQEPAQEVLEEKPAAVKKPRKKAVKKEEAPAEPTHAAMSTSINLKSGRNVNDALFDTNFEIEQPAKAKVVSTKKKQEKAEDLWAVAVVTKPVKSTPAKEKDTQAEEQAQEATATKKAAPKKSAPKKSTKVENTQDNSTEEKKVAKATEKTATETKTAKTTKTDTAKTAAKEEKVVKAKAPAKEEKATKSAPVKEEAPAKAEKAPKAAAKADKVDNDETVIVEGEGKMHGKYVIKKTDKGNFVFKLYSANYRVVAIGAQAYTTLGAAKIGVQSVINNAEKAPIENQTLKNYETLKFPKWEIYLDKKGEYRLRLYATNGSLIATTNDGYTDISGAKNGIAAVGRASKGCAIVRNDNLW